MELKRLGTNKRSFMKISCVQLAAGKEWKKNLNQSLRLAAKTLSFNPDLIVFPENFLFRGDPKKLRDVALHGSATALSLFQTFAKRYQVSLLLGSLVMPSRKKNYYYNASILISQTGNVKAIYHKIHLFDVALPQIKMRESNHFLPGNKVVTTTIRGIRAGLSICYDLRFPELYRILTKKGCKIVFVPANFTYPTGKAHWEVLLRARAIENQLFIVACGQVGVSPSSGIKSYGNSMIIDPWGKILGRLGNRKEGVLNLSLDLKSQLKLRRKFPALKHAVLES